MTYMMAIDPGASGGFAWLDIDGNTNCAAMPPTEGDVCDLIRERRADGCLVAYVEEVCGFCGVGQPGSAMFKFGRGFGFLLGALMAHGIRVELVKPQKWQKHFGLGGVKSSGGKTAWKTKLKAEAQRRFPDQTVTLKTADALLILDWAQQL
jgi:hypothetical protein